MLAFKTQSQNPDADPAVNPEWPWQLIVITSDEQARSLVSDGWKLVSTAEYELYCDRVGTTTEPSFAVDKNNVDQNMTGGVTKITSDRVLWDKTGVYDSTNSQFIPDRDGVLNLNGTVTITNLVDVTALALDVYRNDELWFTVADRAGVGPDDVTLSFSCDVDAYRSSEHVFDLRLRVTPETATCTVSGSDEATAWGMSWVCALYQESPT